MLKKIVLLLSLAVTLSSCTHESNTLYLVVGSYADAEQEGIRLYTFDEITADFDSVSSLKGVSNPSYLEPSANGNRIYAISEDGEASASASAIALNKEQGAMTLMGRELTYSGGPCYIALSPDGRFAVTAEYSGGSITVFPIGEDGKLNPHSQQIFFTGHGLDERRQAQPHLHCVAFTPDGKYLVANDLGSDRTYVFAVEDTISNKLLQNRLVYDIHLEPGSGPRHICFHPAGQFAYLINEISGMVTVFSYREEKLEPVQYIAADTVGAHGSGDIHISPDGKYVYASNRLKSDGIAIFEVNQIDGTLTKVGYRPTGIHPRNFVISPNGKYLLVACRDDNMIQIFKRDLQTGLLEDTGRSIAASKPVCLKFVKK
ncbi:MAG: lactonase family protein [Bacteroidales bacterium]|nr:lactonase family protein [Bacteroidales bacterium]MDD3201723.1 lactonase family protein [Bacteroidales bacterium]